MLCIANANRLDWRATTLLASSRYSRNPKRRVSIVNTLQTGGVPPADSGDQGDGFNLGRIGTTRLVSLLRARQRDLADRFKAIRRNLPMKIFLLLLGFYSANALATVLGQTGDWDVLVAAIIVAVIEGIGFLMYKAPPFLGEKFQSLVRMLNYWKAGLSFGLFVDAFKLGS